MNLLNAEPQTVRELFSRTSFLIDLYQRDYTWTRDHLAKLMEDLAAAFERAREARRRNEAVSPYFLGPIILQTKPTAPFIIDGQQRITTLLLLLMRIARELDGRPPGREIDALIRRGDRFVLNVEAYDRVLASLNRSGGFDVSSATDAERSIAERYAELDELFPDEADGPATASFARWLMDHVTTVVIETDDGAVAYQMFETMNNRGQPLRPADLFRHYLLARIPDPKLREDANEKWREEAEKLQAVGPGEDLTAMRTVLRARYSVSSDEVLDADGALHAWTPETAIESALGQRVDFAKFLGRDLVYFGGWYRRFRQAANTYTRGLEPLFFVTRTGVPHLYRLLLAPLDPADSETEALAKTRVCCAFLDILAARLAWNPKVRRRRKLQADLLETIEKSRGYDVDKLALFYGTMLARMAPAFAENATFGIDQARRTDVHALLARMAAYVSYNVNGSDVYTKLETRSGPKAYDVDTIVPPYGQSTTPIMKDRDVHERTRGLLSAQVLVSRSDSKLLRQASFQERLALLASSSPLFASVSPDAQVPDAFSNFNHSLPISFKPIGKSIETGLEARQEALIGLAERVWDPARIASATGRP